MLKSVAKNVRSPGAMVLASAKEGRGSKKVHCLVVLLKFHTRSRLFPANSGARPSATDLAGKGVGVGVGAVNRGWVMVKLVTALTAPTVTNKL